MTIGAGEILEKLAAFFGERPHGRAAAQPLLIIFRSHHIDPAGHAGMLGAAVLGAKQMILARDGGGKPFRENRPGTTSCLMRNAGM